VACGDGGTRTSVADASARVAIAAAAISGQEAILANEVVGPSYLGFDTGTYPGDKAMRAWRSGNSPYSWAGYYLQSPCHQDDGWMGKRQTLGDNGNQRTVELIDAGTEIVEIGHRVHRTRSAVLRAL